MSGSHVLRGKLLECCKGCVYLKHYFGEYECAACVFFPIKKMECKRHEQKKGLP